MLVPPDLAAEQIVAAVRLHYDLQLSELAFLPLGHDAQAWAFRAAAGGVVYFLKLRRGVVGGAGLRVPRYLADHGARHVVAPLPARDRRLACGVADYTLTLYPYIDGVSGLTRGLRQQDWLAYGAALRDVHDSPLTPELTRGVNRESFSLAQLFRRQRQAPWSAVVAAVAALSAGPSLREVSAGELAALWQQQRVEIQLLVDHFAALAERLRSAPPPFVLCHADIHPNNLLIDTDDQLWIVDWDEVLLAPKECDLMMGIGGLGGYPAGPREQAWFLRGYGGAAVDPVALAFYRHVRAISDIGAYAEQALLMPAASAAEQQAAVGWLAKLFAPGAIVTLAHEAHARAV